MRAIRVFFRSLPGVSPDTPTVWAEQMPTYRTDAIRVLNDIMLTGNIVLFRRDRHASLTGGRHVYY
ncbi:hypothetical protein BIW11_03729 [Tropilaelaps mercedesae]|uniref:Uncharacterized protein n=1 Tax=Tropilaelaps mercedesae TaxID=418985 RepID=A0A1V9XGX8_9ACAR|nr:hypothetical protein BIW11_03729 [Tropilaelaps mercedesae]